MYTQVELINIPPSDFFSLSISTSIITLRQFYITGNSMCYLSLSLISLLKLHFWKEKCREHTLKEGMNQTTQILQTYGRLYWFCSTILGIQNIYFRYFKEKIGCIFLTLWLVKFGESKVCSKIFFAYQTWRIFLAISCFTCF